MGGSGDYFDVADTVIAMTEFVPENVTAPAKAIAAAYPSERAVECGETFGDLSARTPVPKRLDTPRQQSRWQEDPDSSRNPRVKVRGVDELVFGSETVNLFAIEQIIDAG